MGRRTITWAGALAVGMVMLAVGCASSDEPTSLLLSEEELATAPTLRIGDPAPTLVVGEWVTHGSAAPLVKSLMMERPGFPPGRVYVIDFWASWCGPCLAIMPELAALQKRHADAGVAVIAVTALDGMNPRSAVRKVIAANSGQGGVAFAIDGGDEGNATVQAYMHAAREGGIPRTFVVDQRGNLAWIGHPEDAHEVVAALLEGTWDIEAARAERERETRERTESRRLVDVWSEARTRGDREEELRVVRELTAMRPENVAMSPSFWFQGEKIRLLRRAGDGDGARGAFMEGVAEGEFAGEPWALAAFCMAMENLDPALTDPVAERAEELAAARDARKPTSSWEAYLWKAERPWDTQARQVLSEYWFVRGDPERAARLVRQAIAETHPGFRNVLQERQALLRRYEDASER